jgi:hemerythrin-like metal-binding protein
MALIQWDPSFDLHIKEIDRQHRMLVDSINQLYDSMKAGSQKEVLGRQLDKLVNYTVFHFAREEHYFDTLGYPEAKSHEAQHEDFENRVNNFIDDFKAGKQQLSGKIIKFLCDWLVKHIKGSDRRYAPFLISRGIN